MRITESQLRRIVREETQRLNEGPDDGKTVWGVVGDKNHTPDMKKALILKRMVGDLLHLYSNDERIAMTAMDAIRDLVEREVGNNDIPLEFYEYNDAAFVKAVQKRR